MHVLTKHHCWIILKMWRIQESVSADSECHIASPTCIWEHWATEGAFSTLIVKTFKAVVEIIKVSVQWLPLNSVKKIMELIVRGTIEGCRRRCLFLDWLLMYQNLKWIFVHSRKNMSCLISYYHTHPVATGCLAKKGIHGDRVTNWRSESSDLNHTENYLAVLWRELCTGGKHCSFMHALWKAYDKITQFGTIDENRITEPTESMNDRRIEVTGRKMDYCDVNAAG